MAGRPKKETMNEEKVEVTIEEKQPENLENKLAEKDFELSQMKTMMLQMQQQIMSMTKQSGQTQSSTNDDYVAVYKAIPVMSLYDGMLNIGTLPNGQGKLISFSKFGEVRKIVYSDLRDIIASNFNFAKEGYFYIMDEQVVVENGLDDYYKNIITKEKMENIMDSDKNAMLDTFMTIGKPQKDVIVDIITRKMAHGEEFDLNKISVISDVIGKDIKEMAKDLKFSLGEKL